MSSTKHLGSDPSTLVTLPNEKGLVEHNTPSSSKDIEGVQQARESFNIVRVAAVDSGWRDASVNDAGRVIGEHHHKAKLSDEDIELILELRDAGLSYGQIAAKFDDEPRVSKTQVWNVCNGVRRRQTVMGHKRVSRRPDFMPADLDEFDIVGGF